MLDRPCRSSGTGVQVDDDLGVHVALCAGIAIAHNVVPHAAIAAPGDQLLPSRAAECKLSLLGTQLDDGIEEGEVEAPHLDPRAPRRGCYGCMAGEVAAVRAIDVLGGRRGDDGLDGGQGLGQATREEELGGLAVGFGDVLRVVPRRRQRRDRGAQVARAAQVPVHGGHGGARQKCRWRLGGWRTTRA